MPEVELANRRRKPKYPFRDPLKYQRSLIQRRKFELFKRDPAAMRMEGLVKQEDVPPEVNALLFNSGLEKKWNTSIWRMVGPSIGPFSTITLGMLSSTIVDGRDRYRRENIPVRKYVSTGPNGVEEVRKYRLLPIGEGRIPIIINPSLLTLQDEKKVKEHVWNIVEREILKRKESEEPEKGWNPIAPPNEPKEIAFIYRTKEETFRKYLKWYDLHMEGDCITPKGLPFRTIALLEFMEKKHPDKLEEAKKKVEEKRTIGVSVPGEDAVEKGVKLIYKAIHRKPYPSKKTKLELFNCPTHEQSCTKDCIYLKTWWHKFNKSKQNYKTLDTIDGDFIVDPKGMQTPAKGKGSQIKGLSKVKNEY